VGLVSSFAALRYDTDAAGDGLASLVAPPYDVIEGDRRYLYWAKSDHNIVHLTLPESPQAAARTLARWREEGVLVEESPALYWMTHDFIGADEEWHTREGIVGTIEASPYEQGQVLRHEATRSGPKEDRLKLLRATRTQLEPIFLLYDGEPPRSQPEGEPLIDVEIIGERIRLWRLPQSEIELPGPFVIADGHHRYETAVNFRDEEPGAKQTLAVLVSAQSPGLEILPTHRVAQDAGVNPFGMMCSTWDHSALTLYRHENYFRLDSEDELDAREIEQYDLKGVEYTAEAEEAIAAVNEGHAAMAFLLRPPTVAQVLKYARKGETMPAKSTYFSPKLTSGLLLHPL
jgi:uncharacterized protein (DUF1015 family)